VGAKLINADRQTEFTNLIGSFTANANAPKNHYQLNFIYPAQRSVTKIRIVIKELETEATMERNGIMLKLLRVET
jgi:hypothetical protein